jgi:hypothetical protein
VTADPLFMELVQAHERGWGMEQYQDRPSLADMLNRPIVVFWAGEDKTDKGRSTVSVHDQVEELNEILLSLILAGKVSASSKRRLARLFVRQKAVQVTGVRLLIDPKDADEKKPKK